jgi:hypothetical protein
VSGANFQTSSRTLRSAMVLLVILRAKPEWMRWPVLLNAGLNTAFRSRGGSFLSAGATRSIYTFKRKSCHKAAQAAKIAHAESLWYDSLQLSS